MECICVLRARAPKVLGPILWTYAPEEMMCGTDFASANYENSSKSYSNGLS